MTAEEKQGFGKETIDVVAEDLQEDTKKRKIRVALLRRYGRHVVEVMEATLAKPAEHGGNGASGQPDGTKSFKWICKRIRTERGTYAF